MVSPRSSHAQHGRLARLPILQRRADWRNSGSSLTGEADAASDSTKMPDDDLGSLLESPSSISSNVENEHMDLDVSMEDILSGETGTKFAERLTVLDECEEVRGDYLRMPRTFCGRPCYQKDDGTMFLFYSFWQHHWCFGPGLGRASETIGDTCIPEGVELPAVEFAGCRNETAAHGAQEDACPTLPVFGDHGCGYHGHLSAEAISYQDDVVSVPSRICTIGGQYSTTHGCTIPRSTTVQLGLGGPIFATQVTVVIDDDTKRGEYQLLPEMFNGRPLYRREDGAVLLFFDDRRSGWQFVEMSQDDRKCIAEALCQRPAGNSDAFDISSEGLLLKMPPQLAGRHIYHQASPRSDRKAMVEQPVGVRAACREAATGGAHWLTVIDESAAINGEYCLVDGDGDGVSHYRKEDGSMFMFYDASRSCWRFCETFAEISTCCCVVDASDSAVADLVFAGSEELSYDASRDVDHSAFFFSNTDASPSKFHRSGAKAALSKAKCAACTVS